MPQFVREVMLTPLGRSHFLSNARTEVGMWKIGAEDIRNFPLPLPPLDVQQEIVRLVAEKRNEIARLREAAVRKARESKAEIEAMILGTKKL
jgi:restriction endonuclease S subunit